MQKLVLFAALVDIFPVIPGSPSQGQNDMVERPSDKFLSRKAYELEHKTGFSRKELLTFHKHYGACSIDSLGRITEEDKQAFLKEMDLENDEITLQVMDSIQAIEKKRLANQANRKKELGEE